MPNNTDTVKPSPNVSPPAEPAGGRKDKDADKKFCTADSSVIWKAQGWQCMVFKNADGTSGHIVTNGQTAIYLDSLGNINLCTGKPPQAGTGGQLVVNSAGQIHNVNGSMAIHAKGAGDATREKDGSTKSGETTNETPAYSLLAEGEIAIEAVGSEVGIKADNITINAINNLTLKAGESVNIEAGNGNGKFNVFAADYNINATFSNQTIDGGIYKDGPGEETTNAIKPGSINSINTAGSVNYIVNGTYDIGVKGQYNLASFDNITMSTGTGGYAIKMPRLYSESIGGIKKTKVIGAPVTTGEPPIATWNIILGANKYGMKIVSANGIDLKAVVGDSNLDFGGIVSVKTAGILSFKSPTIFLN